jgi:sarcosine oxidase/L-pipecolate oxidase
MSHYFISKLKPSQHGFLKTKSTASNFVTCLAFISPLVCSQSQVHSIYFDFSRAFDIVPHFKLCAYGLSDSYVNWFRIYFTNRYPSVRISGAFSSPFAASSGFQQTSVLGSLLFNIFINDMCNVIRYSRCLLFADGINIFRAINSSDGCTILQATMNTRKLGVLQTA